MSTYVHRRHANLKKLSLHHYYPWHCLLMPHISSASQHLLLWKYIWSWVSRSNSWLSCCISTKSDLHGSLPDHGSLLYSWELITAVIVESLMNTSLHVFIFKMCPIGPWWSTTVHTSITEDCRYPSFNVANNAIHVPCHLDPVIIWNYMYSSMIMLHITWSLQLKTRIGLPHDVYTS